MNELSNEEIRAICLGKFSARKCPCCDNNGTVYWDNNTGEGVGPTPPAGLAIEDIGFANCDDCNGVGFILKIQEY